MPTQREVMTVAGQRTYLYVAGNTTVGVRISNTWVGKASFYGSYDGVTFQPISMTPYASGTPVQTTTTTGNWFTQVGNLQVIAVEFTTATSGSMTATIIASQDGSWQAAFLAPSSRFVNANATAATTTLTIAAATNQAQRLKTLKITTNKQPAWLTSPNVIIYDGSNTGTVLWQFDLPPNGSAGVIYDITLPATGIVNTPGNALTVTCASAGTGATVQINAEVEPA